MTRKTCFKCNAEKDITEFYVHERMADGHLNKCKSCTRADVSKHRKTNLEKLRQYDRVRYRLDPSRSYGLRKKYDSAECKKRWSLKNQYKRKAHRAVYAAIKRGELIRPSACNKCGAHVEDGAIIHAHHPDYSEPLFVEWLCTRCHGIEHSMAIFESNQSL